MNRSLPLALCAALACTSPNPNAQLDGQPGSYDGPVKTDGRRPGSPGGPCLPGGNCDPGLKCIGGVCVPVVDGGQWDLPPPEDGPTQPTCNPVGYKNVLVHTDATGDWTVVLEPQTKDKTLKVVGATAKQAAAVFDYDDTGQQVAGFVASRSASYNTPGEEATAALQEIVKNVSGQLSVRRQGRKVKTHDGFQSVVGITLDHKAQITTDITQVRRLALAGLLGVPIPNLTLVPPPFGKQTTAFVIRLAAVQRSDKRVLFIGAVTDRASDDDIKLLVSDLSKDLSSATLLAQANAQPDPVCDTQTVTSKPKNDVDIIWVMDESGSMDSKRSAIAAGTSTFFTQLQQTGLDFRMGVTNVVSPTGTFKTGVGKFCSSMSSDKYSDGGTDRFLLSSEQNIFSACIKNPPGYEGGLEYGLVNSEAAVKNHLPRAANDPAKIRKGAQVVVIVVTDEMPQGLKDQFSSGQGNILSQCVLNSSTQAKVDAHVKPYIDYLSGQKDPAAEIDYYQVIGGTCTSSGPMCSYKPEVAHGYKELALQLNGLVHDVCQADLTGTVTSIISNIVANSAPLKLQTTPIPSSLQVALDSVTLQRSNASGFKHEAGTRDLLFTGSAKIQLGSTVVASYQVWK